MQADHESKKTSKSRPRKSRSPRARRGSLGEQLPGYLPKGRISPKSYVPPKSRTAGQAEEESESPPGSGSHTDSPRKLRDLPSYHDSPSGLASPSCGNKKHASLHGRQPLSKHSTKKPPRMSPGQSPVESLRESPILSPLECASPPSGGSMSPRVELAASGRGTPGSRASSRKRGGSAGRVSWQHERPGQRAEASACGKRRAGQPSLYQWLVSRLHPRAGHGGVAQERGPDAEAETLDLRSPTSDISNTRAFWKATSSVSGPDAPVMARSSLRADLCTALLAVAVLVLATSVIWVLFVGGGDRKPVAATALRCVTDTCIKYEKLLSLTMDENARPCDDFYQHVCGTSLRTGRRPTYEQNWDRFLNDVARRVTAFGESTGARDYSAGPFPSNAPRLENKAVTSIRACLSPLERDNVQEVKEILAAAGLPWPDRSARPDVIDSLFFMSQRVYQALFVDIRFSTVDNQRSLAFICDDQFKRVYQRIGEHMTTMHIRSHFRTSYESFASNREEVDHKQRQERLFNTFIVMKNLLDGLMQVRDANMSSEPDPAAFLSMTPSVSESRWEAALRRYLNVSLRSFSVIFVENVAQFRALFRLRRLHGEDDMADFLGWFAVQLLVPYTNRRLLGSYYQSVSVAGDEKRKDCVTSAYLAYAFALDNFLVRDVAAAIQLATGLVDPLAGSFRRLLSGNRSSLMGDALPPPNGTRILAAFDIVNASREAAVLHLYDDFPDVHLEQPLRNSIEVARYLYDRHNSTTTYKAVDGNMFDGFHLNPQLLSFPWYASDARPGILLGGLGSRLAGTLYLDFVERRSNPEAVYRENRRCLGSENFDEDSYIDLVAAAAAVNVVWDAFQDVNVSQRGPLQMASELEVPAPYSDATLLFAFYCWLTCGDQWGRAMCNVPLKHSPHFASAFGCPPGAPMNPTDKCRMIV